MAEKMDLRPLPLAAEHAAAGARFAPFAGWSMPAQFAGARAEHDAVRARAGLFDVSHMGEVEVRGAQAGEAIDRLVCGAVSGLEVGRSKYTLMCREDGGIIDDLIVYRLGPEHWLLCINAARVEPDLAQIEAVLGDRVDWRDTSEAWAQLAVQGPAASSIVERAATEGAIVASIDSFGVGPIEIGAARLWAARTGYTGEDGFELFIPVASVSAVYAALCEAGGETLSPCGLAARDILRTEARLHLYGQDMDESRDPYSAGLGWTVALEKGEFVGRTALAAIKREGRPAIFRGFVFEGRRFARPGAAIRVEGAERVVGALTSGTYSYTVGAGIGLGYIEPSAEREARFEIEGRGGWLPARATKKAFYKHSAGVIPAAI